jgi:abequosyltransferase
MDTAIENQNTPDVQLSLCIATMNRGTLIGETLDSILSQSEPSIEIIILDGASKDNTQEVVASYTAKYSNIRYLREDTASGVDIDFDKAVMAARGQYCWLLGDDDLLKPGAIRRVLDACVQGHDLVIVNAEVRSADLTELLNPKRLEIESDLIYPPEESDRLLKETGSHLTFIGAVIIRRALWLARDRQRYFGTEFVHVGVVFQAPLQGTALVLAGPLISIRYGNAHWSERAFEIWMFKWPQLIWSFGSISENARFAVSPSEPWRNIKNLLLYRAFGSYNSKAFRRLIRPKVKVLDSIAPWTISLLPGMIVNLAAVGFFLLLKPHLKGMLKDLFSSPFWIGNLVRRG